MSRRAFLKTAASVAALGTGSLVGAAQVPAPGGESLVRLLVESDREILPGRLAAAIRAGLGYRDLLGALAEAGAREVRPYPVVGYKYHAVMGLHAIDAATLAAPVSDLWLPAFWAADAFKEAQAAEGGHPQGWLAPLVGVPERVQRGEGVLLQALEAWDPQTADLEAVALWRSGPVEDLCGTLLRCGARDFRDIGHKAIAAANFRRLTERIPPGRGETLLRSTVWALLNHEGEPDPATADLAPDRPWRRNLALAGRPPGAPAGWDYGQVLALFRTLRAGTDAEASEALRAGLDRGTPEPALWSAIFLAAGELMLRRAGILSVHASTAANALYYAAGQVQAPETRRLLLLQAAAFMPLFRDLLGGERVTLGVEDLTPPEAEGDRARSPETIFETLGDDRHLAARQALGYLAGGGALAPFVVLARGYALGRCTGYHDFKLLEAALENAAAIPSPWRERYLAAVTPYFNGPADPPNPVVAGARALLA